MPRIVLKENESEKALDVSETDATIGRDPACGFFVEGPNSRVVSARHARIFFQDDAWWIEDTSRNGTILDDERLLRGQRHALRVGQLIGLGESGPRYKVVLLESRQVAQTIIERPESPASAPASSAPAPGNTAPRGAPPREAAPKEGTESPAAPASGPTQAMVDARTAAIRYSEAIRAGLSVDERTEPTETSTDWLIHVVLRAVHTNQLYEVQARTVKLGRAPECNVQIPPDHGASVSREHAEIAIHDGGVMLRDIGSRNGTFINGQRIDAAHPAAKSDRITLGSGGPTYAIDELRLVKGTSSSEAGEATARPRNGGTRPSRPEPPTGPGALAGSGAAVPSTQVSGGPVGTNRSDKRPLEGSRRVRVILWFGVVAAAVIAAAILALM
ncbi:MAG TPA: FHA domain-containing protein [Gemmatimonadaceae bacterium]|nr:FHA domain-containing protein [Gemmatimonadaceae bacterium]